MWFLSLQLNLSVFRSVPSLFSWCQGWWSLRCSCPRGICLLGRLCSPGSWSGIKQRCQTHGWIDHNWQMQLPNHSVGNLAGQAAWTIGPAAHLQHHPWGPGKSRSVGAPGFSWPQTVRAWPHGTLSGREWLPAAGAWSPCAWCSPLHSALAAQAQDWLPQRAVGLGFLRPWPLIWPRGLRRVSCWWLSLCIGLTGLPWTFQGIKWACSEKWPLYINTKV